MTAHPVLLQKKYARIVSLLSRELHIPLSSALGVFYHSETYQLIREGISDLHCMSDQYLVDEIQYEISKKGRPA